MERESEQCEFGQNLRQLVRNGIYWPFFYIKTRIFDFLKILMPEF